MFRHLTVVNVRVVLFKVHDGRECFNAVLFDELLVLRLDHPHSDGVGVVVDVLQVFQSLVARFAVARVFKMKNDQIDLEKVVF